MVSARLRYIHTSAGTGRPMIAHDCIRAIPGFGLEGDRYANARGKYSRSPGVREVTIFEIETLEKLKHDHGINFLPSEHRRNLTTEGVALSDLIGRKFSIGEVTLQGLRACRPCRYLNLMSRKQVSARLEDQAGLFCRIITEGMISIGDPILIET